MTKRIDRFIRNVTDAGKPRGAPHIFPYPGHRSMEEVMQEEAKHRMRGHKAWDTRLRNGIGK